MSGITIRKLPESANALAESGRTEVTWVEQLIAVGVEVGGVDLPASPDDPAPGADLSGVR